jgi:hypothetical protein
MPPVAMQQESPACLLYWSLFAPNQVRFALQLYH